MQEITGGRGLNLSSISILNLFEIMGMESYYGRKIRICYNFRKERVILLTEIDSRNICHKKTK
jgi:hypothetical protein